MLSTDHKWKLTPRLHSVKFVFDKPTPADEEAPEEVVFENPFSCDSPGLPKRFVFKSPTVSHTANAKIPEARHEQTSCGSNNGQEDDSMKESQAPHASSSAQGNPYFPHVQGPACQPGNTRFSATAIVGAAWALLQGSQSESRRVDVSVMGWQSAAARSSNGRIRVDVDKTTTVAELLRSVTEASITPMASVEHDDNEISSISRSVLSFRSRDDSAPSWSGHPLVVDCMAVADEAVLSAFYDDRLFARSSVRFYLHDLEHVVWQLSSTRNESRTLGDIQILSPASQRHMVQLNRPLPSLKASLVHDLIAEQAAIRPRQQAVNAWDGDLTYSELQSHVDRLACHLRAAGVGPEVLVPVIFEKSLHSVVAMLAVVKAGGAIVALDPSLPKLRIQMILDDVKASVVVSSPQSETKIPSGGRQLNRIIVDGVFLKQLPSPRQRLLSSATVDNALYVVFTSGSTGKPKGVVVTHASFSSSAAGFSKAIHLDGPTVRVLQYSSFSFDISMLEIFTTLMTGACLCIPSDEHRMNNLADCINELDVNWAMLTPSVAKLIRPDDVPGLKVLCLVGEALPQAVADTWADHVTTINAYGPAECSAITIVGEPRQKGVKSISLGRPPNCAVWVLDENGKVAPFDTIGEIVIEGAPVARGYLNDQSKTDEVFFEDADFLRGVVRRPRRCYRTGDLGRMKPDGSIDFFGRRDGQVKVNGQRVELGEIEHQLRQLLVSHSQATSGPAPHSAWEVAVELLGPKDGDVAVLCAFVSCESDKTSLLASEDILLNEVDQPWSIIRLVSALALSSLTRILPAYMIPKFIIPCRRLPLSASGKADRKTLRALGSSLSLRDLLRSSAQPSASAFVGSPAAPLDQGLADTDTEDSSVDQHTEASDKHELTPSEASFSTSDGLDPPLSSVENALRKAWSTVLGLSEMSISLDDDFFRLGGDSIGAIKVVAACRKLSLQINVANIFKNSVLRRMALVCKSTAEEATTTSPAHYAPFHFLGAQDVDDLREEAAFQCDVTVHEIEDLYPCTHMQEGLMAVNLTRPGSYTGRWIHPLPSGVDLVKFKRSWEDVQASSPILRTRFATTSSAGSLQAVVKERVQWRTHHDLEAYLAEDDSNPMFPGDSLNRFALVTAADGQRTFVWTIHHMLYDGWSLAMLCNRLNETYHGRAVKPATDYRHFISYSQHLDESESLTFWKHELRDVPRSTFPAPSKPGHHSSARAVVRDSLAIHLDAATGLTMSTLLRAAWSLMIGHRSGSDDVLFGATVSGRNAPLKDIENIEGPTIATVPVRVLINRKESVLEFLRRLREHAAAMIPFEQTGIQRIKTFSDDTRRGCDFQNLLVIQAGGGWDETGPGPLGKPSYREEFTTFPVTCEAWLRPGRVEFATHVDEDVTSRVFVARAIETVKVLMVQLSRAVSSSSATAAVIGDLAFDKVPEMMEIEEMCRVGEPEKVTACIHDLIFDKNGLQTGQEAVMSTSDALTYEQLDAFSSALARHLREAGIKPKTVVALCFEKSVWTVVAMLGVLRAGASFVPLDPGQPISRLRAVVEQVDAKFALVSDFHSRTTDLGVPHHIVVNLSFLASLPRDTITPLPAPDPEDPAYVIFTSGSTGTPKGIVVSHSAFASSARAHGRVLGMTRANRVLQFSAYSFDASLFEILSTLVHGGTVCVPSEAERFEGLAQFARSAGVNFALLTPSVARMITPSELPAVRTLTLGGEAPDAVLIDTWLDAGRRVFNAYGPSECSVIAAVQSCVSGGDPKAIGKSVGCSSWIVDMDDHSVLVQDGEVGELLIGGPTLASGYINDPAKTDSAFIVDPTWRDGHSRRQYARLYKTGDLVRRSPDGTMVYVGRKDLQIKIHGQRVELGDAESHVNACSAVKTGVVVFPSAGLFSGQIVAVVDLVNNISGQQGHRVSALSFRENMDDVKREVAERVPSIMLPAHWVDIATFSGGTFPLSASGKIDRRQIQSWLETLAVTESRDLENELAFEALIDRDEQVAYELAQEISSLTRAKALSTSDACAARFENVFLHCSGLDSLTMMSLMHFINLKHRVRVSMQLLMDEKTTIRSLAAFITASRTSSPSATTSSLTHGVDIMAEIEKHDISLRALQDERRLHRRTTERPKVNDLTVFLTGSNGYLGTQILRQLLERPDVACVIALVRGETTDKAKGRLVEAATKALWWTEFHDDKLEVWKGDLSMPQLGLEAPKWHTLSDGHTVDVVIHNGAVVHWNKGYAALEAVNVLSTVQLLRLAVHTPTLRLAYVSGGRQWSSADEDDDAKVAKTLSASMGYSQTKFVAEVLVKRAARRCPAAHANAAVFRPGLIVGTPTEGVANVDDYVWRATAASIAVGGYNADDDDAWLHLSDATTTASAVVRTALEPQRLATGVELHEEGLTWGSFWGLVRGMGYDVRPLTAAQWLASVKEQLASQKEAHPLWPLAHLLEDQAMEWDVRVDKSPEIPVRLKVAIRKNMDFLARVGFLPPSGASARSRAVATGFSRSSYR
ncbi:Nonribosomal peptide synthase atnA [Colletotrichum orbiculare MAFF 240422]|uniref:Nonribosomal peptide synthase atnA n=1 Tax=Colletotrichum orbiculare (strain 104-T / ATCC 96160 / CBS 514.97 / LARS 414 / MAFF 240422) TaxID=1213857 RepID=A0A484FDM5_COLOR|nr:Nonribosomal peptide synthase atnA [Colletotrichum orbiculare MAFF 240422]